MLDLTFEKLTFVINFLQKLKVNIFCIKILLDDS